jgi:putative transposase
VLAEPLEEAVVEIAGRKGQHIPERTAVRHGHEVGEVTLGGRRVAVDRPRLRSADGRFEVRLRTYEYFDDRDPQSLGAGADAGWRLHPSLPQDPGAGRPGGGAGAVDVALLGLHAFIEGTRRSLGELMSRRLDDVHLAVIMIDGSTLASAPTWSRSGSRPRASSSPLGVWEGSTENASVATALLSDLVERGLDPSRAASS